MQHSRSFDCDLELFEVFDRSALPVLYDIHIINYQNLRHFDSRAFFLEKIDNSKICFMYFATKIMFGGVSNMHLWACPRKQKHKHKFLVRQIRFSSQLSHFEGKHTFGQCCVKLQNVKNYELLADKHQAC